MEWSGLSFYAYPSILSADIPILLSRKKKKTKNLATKDSRDTDDENNTGSYKIMKNNTDDVYIS